VFVPEPDTYLSEVVTSVNRTRFALLDPIFYSLVANTTKLSDAAVRTGNVDVLSHVMRQGDLLPWGMSTYMAALECNRLEVLNFMLSRMKGDALSCQEQAKLLATAIQSGHLRMLQLLHERDLIFTWPMSSTEYEWFAHSDGVFKHGLAYAAELGRLDMVIWMEAHGCALTDEFFEGATYSGKIKIWSFGQRKGGEWRSEHWSLATRLGHVHVLEWAHTRVQPVNVSNHVQGACLEAANAGKIACLEWFRNKAVPLGSSLCYEAVMGEKLETLQWLRRHECAWDEAVVIPALDTNRFNMFSWSIENGCPSDREACRECALLCGDRQAFLTFLDSLG